MFVEECKWNLIFLLKYEFVMNLQGKQPLNPMSNVFSS